MHRAKLCTLSVELFFLLFIYVNISLFHWYHEQGEQEEKPKVQLLLRAAAGMSLLALTNHTFPQCECKRLNKKL